jgi:aminoglycoside phosphotransferase (APT) family kinase protein
MHALGVARADGLTTAVLRSYVLADVVEEEPDIVEREAAVLGVLRQTRLPTPELLGADPRGERTGVPALLMTLLPGRLEWSPRNLDAWLHELAEVLPALHATPLDAAHQVQPFRPYEPTSWAPPAWMRYPHLWERAVDVFQRSPMDPDRVFIHRDYHPGNVLWHGHRITGIVDWQAASEGPRTVDVFHCRVNLIDRFGLEVADRFVGIWKAISGSDYHPWAEVVMLVEALDPEPGKRGQQSARDLEAALALRLSELGA